jgi:hypothetical protein
MQKTKLSIIHLLALIMLLVPVLALAQPVTGRLVPCDGLDCNFNKFMELINTVISFILFNLAVPLAAIMFAYAGVKLLFSGGEKSDARTKAKEIFTNTVIGLALAAGAWLIIRTILFVLGYDGAWIGF